MLRQKVVGVDYTHGVNQVSALECRHFNVLRPANICITTFPNSLTKCGTQNAGREPHNVTLTYSRKLE